MTVSLFLGGARSGKSRLAQAAAERCAGSLTYLATAQPGDAEMAERIARHRADRGPRWTTIECPIAIAQAIGRAETPILVDCLTLWLSNLMFAGQDIAAATAGLVAALGDAPTPVVIVSNEVGWGIVPDNPLGRTFRDHAGRLNQAVAAVADRSYLVVAGLLLALERATIMT